MNNTLKKRKTLGYFRNVLLPVLVYSTMTGIVVGLIVGLYGKLASILNEISAFIYEQVRLHPAYSPLLILGTVAIALIIALLLKFTPECKGSGVPRTEGVLKGLLTFRWLRVFLTTIGTSLLTYFSGASLGSEGPSIQLGATSAQGCCELLRCRMAWTKYAMAGGAGTGLAVAFNAPMTGILFVLEEAYKKVTPMILMVAGCVSVVGVLTANSISNLWGGTGYLFDFGSFPDKFALQDIWMLLILGIVVGLSAVAFNWLIFRSQKLVKKHIRIPQWAKLVITFALVGAVGIACTDTIGGGHELILKVGGGSFVWWMLLVLLLTKLFLILLCFNSGTTGGLFIPMLTLGALIGGLFGNAFMAAGMDQNYYKVIVVMAMAAFFAASVRTPITASVLVLEVTGQFHSFLFVAMTIFLAYFVAQLTKVEPLYDGLLEVNVEDEYAGKEAVVSEFEVTVQSQSFADGKAIGDLLLPPHCHIQSIMRGDGAVIASSDAMLHGEDLLHIQLSSYNTERDIEYIEKLINE